jgi:hypothetical protein
MSERREEPALGTGFNEALAQWRLRLRTEVKRASSLPSSMFDACDPMLETRLCDTAESMLAHMPLPAPAVTSPLQPGEQRIEQISRDELSRLPSLIANAPAPAPALDAGLEAEHLAILADLTTHASGTASRRAARLLATALGLDPDVDLEAAASQLWQLLPSGAEPMPDADDRLGDLCRRIATTVVALAAEADAAEDA